MRRPPPGRQSRCEGLTTQGSTTFPMAEQNLSAAAPSHSRVPRSATHSGVTHIRQYQPDRYTIIGNHLAQHRDLSLTAIGVGTHILSLPEGAPVDIRTLAARFPEGRDRIAFALRELEAHGYVERVRERTAEGRVITRTYAHSAPAVTGAGPEAGARQGRPPRRLRLRLRGRAAPPGSAGPAEGPPSTPARPLPDLRRLRTGLPGPGTGALPGLPGRAGVTRSRCRGLSGPSGLAGRAAAGPGPSDGPSAKAGAKRA